MPVSLAGVDSGMGRESLSFAAVIYDWLGLISTSLEVLKSLIAGKALPCQEFLIPSGFDPGGTIAQAARR